MEDSVRSGNLERGWNDPPEFLHDGSHTNAVTKLNKRVSHNLDGKLGPTPVASVLTEPPKMPMTSSKRTQLNDDKLQDPESNVSSLEMSIEDIEKIFVQKIEFCKENKLSVCISDTKDGLYKFLHKLEYLNM